MPEFLEFLGLLTVLAGPDGAADEARPNPTALPWLIRPEEVEDHRSLACTFYDRCLDAALRRGWRSWSCQACRIRGVASRHLPATRALRGGSIMEPWGANSSSSPSWSGGRCWGSRRSSSICSGTTTGAGGGASLGPPAASAGLPRVRRLPRPAVEARDRAGPAPGG